MATGVHIGQLTQPGSTGNQSYSGAGFHPGLVLFSPSGVTATGIGTSHTFGFGAMSGSSSRWAGGDMHLNGQSTGSRNFSSSQALMYADSSSTVNASTRADHVSLDGDGYTINWGNLFAANSDLTSWIAFHNQFHSRVGTFDLNNSTGHQSISGLGIRPTLVIFYVVLVNTTETNGASAGNATIGMGAAASSSERFAGATSIKYTVTTISKRYLTASKCLVQLDTAGTGINAAADFVSMDSDGFTIDVTTAPAAAIRVGYIAMNGVVPKVGTFTAPTSNGTQDVTTTGIMPNCVLFTGSCVNLDTIESSGNNIFGAMTAAGQFCNTAVHVDNNGVNRVGGYSYQTNKCLTRLAKTGSGNPTVQFEAAYSAFAANKFTLNWTTTQVTADQFGYIALQVPDYIATAYGASGKGGWMWCG